MTDGNTIINKGYYMITFQDFLSMQENFLRIINSNTDLDIRHDLAYTSTSDMPASYEKTRRVSRFIGVKIGQARNAAVKTASVTAKIITHPVTQTAIVTATFSFFATILITALLIVQSPIELISVLALIGMFFYVCYLAFSSTF